MKRKLISAGLLWILIILVLIAPAAGLTIADGAKITATTGITSPVITVTDADIPQDGTLTIDVSSLNAYVEAGTLTDANVAIDDTAASATWTAVVTGDILTLTSTGGNTTVGETVTITFTGAGGSPWVLDTSGEQTATLTVNRTDALDLSTINFVIETTALPSGNLTITDGSKITTTTGETSPAITVAGSDIPADGTINIDITPLHGIVASSSFTDANILIASDAVAATWTGKVTGDLLTLTSAGSNTTIGESVTVTFTGAGGNPWVSNTIGEQTIPLAVTRTDTSQATSITFVIETALPPAVGLRITDGPKVTARNGNSTAVITIIDSEIAEDGIIAIDISPLHGVVANGTFTDANIVISDTTGNATWTGVVEGDVLTLTSTRGPTVVGETVTVTFTGAAGSAWISDTGTAVLTGILAATRIDTGDTAIITFTMETAPGPGALTVVPGDKIVAADGESSVVITIADAPILQYDTILIDVSGFYPYLSSGIFTDENVVIRDTATEAVWTPALEYESLFLKSNGGPTAVGETVIVTFTGARGNPWIPNTGGEQLITPPLLRMDNFAYTDFNLAIDTAPPPGFTVTEGSNITASNGVTSTSFTISDSEIAPDGTITIDVSGMNSYVKDGVFVDANLIIDDTAANASWTGAVADNILTLTSTGGSTAVGESVRVTFTGAEGSAWIPNTHGPQTIPLVAFRTDIMGPGKFSINIETSPPTGYLVVANFTATPTDDIVPLAVSFTDLSTGTPTSWNWDFGDGEISAEHNPVHTYANVGTYAVILTAANDYGSDTRTQWNFIHVLNGGIHETTTGIDGLSVTADAGVQNVTVDVSILLAALMPNNSVLEIQPPLGQGWKNITLYSFNGAGFQQDGSIITGTVTGCHMETEDFTPPAGFSGSVGQNAAFWFSMDLASYPVDAGLSARIWEGTMPEVENKLNRIAVGNGAVSIGTAYGAVISKTNLPAGTPVKVHMSVGSGWNPSLSGGPGYVFIWRIADDGTSGQILPTTLVSSDPANNLDYYEADSPAGMSTFGLSSFTGSNNPFQMIALAAQEVVSQPSSSTGSSMGSGSSSGDASIVSAPTAVTTIPVPDSPMGAADFAMITRVFTNPDGIISQAGALKSTDGLVSVSLGLGVVARNSSGLPLDAVSIRRLPAGELPVIPAGGELSFAGTAYDLQPDGATFSPPIEVSFTVPPEGKEFVIQQYDPVSGTWIVVPTRIDAHGTVIAQISHLCTFALFTKAPGSMNPTPTITSISSKERAEKGLEKTALPISGGIMSFIGSNPLLSAMIGIFVVIGAAFGYTRLQALRNVRGVHHYGDEEGGSGTSVDEALEGKRQKAYAGIINVLNDIDGQVRDLERAMKSRAPAFVFPADEAAPIVSRFFYSCQVAEERIKTADHEGYITRKQVHDLNVQLDGAVQKMVELARQSETLNNFVVEKFGAQAGQ